MTESANAISGKAGLPPGALVHVGKRKAKKTRISVIDYNKSDFHQIECETVEQCMAFRDANTVSWINVDGLHNTQLIDEIGKQFDLHPLLLEDVLNTRHRPKVEEFDNCIFIMLKMLGINKSGHSIVTEQVSFVLGKNWVLSFQEQEGDIFDDLRQRLKSSKGMIRERGNDYLLYRLIDTIVDHYFFVTEHFAEAIEKLDEEVLKTPDQSVLMEIQRLKKSLIHFRRSVSPLREAIASMQRDGNSLIKKSTIRYLRDVYEHIIQVGDSIETQRDLLGGIMDLYLSGVSNKMNQVMQVLTIMATIFIPLTFIAGIYGMNFDHMPELHWKYGYPAVWILMILVIVLMIIYFRRKKWL